MPATFQDQSSEQNPTITLDADQGVRLVVVDSNGCIGQDSTTARVLQGSGIIFPNSFSPNDDGMNDFFKPHPAEADEQIRTLLKQDIKAFKMKDPTSGNYYLYVDSFKSENQARETLLDLEQTMSRVWIREVN